MSLNALVKSKLQKIEDRKSQNAGNTEHALAVYSDYALYFQGADEALAAAGVSADDRRSVTGAISLINADMAAADQRLALEKELG